MEVLGALKFRPIGGADDGPPSRQEWLKRAGEEYVPMALGAVTLKMDNAQVATMMAGSEEAWLELAGTLQGVIAQWKANLEVLECIQARVLTGLSQSPKGQGQT